MMTEIHHFGFFFLHSHDQKSTFMLQARWARLMFSGTCFHFLERGMWVLQLWTRKWHLNSVLTPSQMLCSRGLTTKCWIFLGFCVSFNETSQCIISTSSSLRPYKWLVNVYVSISTPSNSVLVNVLLSLISQMEMIKCVQRTAEGIKIYKLVVNYEWTKKTFYKCSHTWMRSCSMCMCVSVN